MNCGNFHHFISGLAGGFLSAGGGGGDPAGGASRTCNRVGLKGKFFFPGICQASFSWSCTEGTSNPKIVYTGHFDRIEKKLLLTVTRIYQPFSITQSSVSQTFFSDFCFHWALLAETVDHEPFLGRSLLLRPLQNFQGQPPGGWGPLPGPSGGSEHRRLLRGGRHSAGVDTRTSGFSAVPSDPTQLSRASFRVGNAAKTVGDKHVAISQSCS